MSRTECARQGAEAIGAKTRRREGCPVFRTIRSVYPLYSCQCKLQGHCTLNVKQKCTRSCLECVCLVRHERGCIIGHCPDHGDGHGTRTPTGCVKTPVNGSSCDPVR
eukprot:5014216-Prymnesium_polylepis.1